MIPCYFLGSTVFGRKVSQTELAWMQETCRIDILRAMA